MKAPTPHRRCSALGLANGLVICHSAAHRSTLCADSPEAQASARYFAVRRAAGAAAADAWVEAFYAHEDPAPADAAALAARFPGWSFRRDCKADLWVGLRTARGLQTRVGAQTAPLLHRKLARHP